MLSLDFPGPELFPSHLSNWECYHSQGGKVEVRGEGQEEGYICPVGEVGVTLCGTVCVVRCNASLYVLLCVSLVDCFMLCGTVCVVRCNASLYA